MEIYILGAVGYFTVQTLLAVGIFLYQRKKDREKWGALTGTTPEKTDSAGIPTE